MSTESTSSEQINPPALSVAGRIWSFVRILNVRLRFIFLMVLVGLVAANWEQIQNHYDRWRRPATASEAVQASEIEYYCPMHPNVVRAAPGNCPICGMPLSKRAKSGNRALAEGVLAQVQLSPQKMQMGRIATTVVDYRLLSREIRAVGIVDYDETRRAFVAARIKGRLDKLYVNFVGQKVKKGDPLASIYSPELLIAQEELISAGKQQPGRSGPSDDAQTFAKSIVDSAKKKLTLWGLSDQQVQAIIDRGKATTHLDILSPIEGIVTEKKVLEGHYVAEGDDLYTVADLTRVWTQVKIFEDDIAGVRIGTATEVTSVAFPNEMFAGRIAFIAYTVEPATRTVAARVEVDNPDLKLRPGMYVRAVIRLPVGRVIDASTPTSVPASAPTGPNTDRLAKAYLDLVAAFAGDKADAASLTAFIHEAQALKASGGEIEQIASDVAQAASGMTDSDLKGQREKLKAMSARTVAFLRAHPPTNGTLFIAHCPMADADWLQSSELIANPYFGSEMPKCGKITGRIEAGSPAADDRFVQGYFCPIYPDRLFDKPSECPIDKFPTKLVRIERTLAVPESAVINTGSRTVVYRESAPGTYDMVEVKLGARAGEFYPVVEGVAAGERVVTGGAFVVDAENRLNPAASGQYFGASGSPAPAGQQHQHGG